MWGEAAYTTTYLINRSSTGISDNTSREMEQQETELNPADLWLQNLCKNSGTAQKTRTKK